MAYFVYLTLASGEARRFINALIFLADPTEKNPAHITLKGPMQKEPEDLGQIEKDFTQVKLSVFGTGDFFSHGQNTVYLRCDSPMIKKHWKKKDYPYNPHITIYDGRSKLHAEKIFALLNGHRLHFEVGIDKAICIARGKQRSLDLLWDLDLELINRAAGHALTQNDIRNMPPERRFHIMERLVPQMTWAIHSDKVLGGRK